MLRSAIAATGIAWLGALPRREVLALPERHLGLVLPDEVARFDAVVAAAAEAVADYLDLPAIAALAQPVEAVPAYLRRMPPLSQRIAIARDDAFAFIYPHLLADWRAAGAELSFFSPLADEPPDLMADAVFLPGGYPELHGAGLAAAARFKAGLAAARDRGALLYGECGGFMVMGETLVDRQGASHPMAGLLPVVTRIDRPRRTLGYRRLSHASPLPWPAALMGHEFHYSSAAPTPLPPLFAATDALGVPVQPMGAQLGRVMGSYAHVIDMA
jgi:cobyrinic acid a,c-diamide synthase